MSYRTIALASCLLMVGCGGAPPPSASAPPPPSAGALREPSTPSPPRNEGPAQPGPTPPTTPPPTTTPPPPPVEGQQGTAPPGRAGGEAKGSISQAVVEVREPLGGKLTPDDIRRILDRHGDLFGDCYTLGAGGKLKDFKGVVTLKATIGPNGDINQIDVTKSTTQNVKVDVCVIEAFKKIKFQRPKGGATTVIVFPVAFNGVEQIQ